MSYQQDDFDKDISFGPEAAGHRAFKTPDLWLYQPLAHNELVLSALRAMQQGEFKTYRVFDFSCSSSDNPIQIICRHKESGRIKVANIDRINGSVDWDDDTIPWH